VIDKATERAPTRGDRAPTKNSGIEAPPGRSHVGNKDVAAARVSHAKVVANNRRKSQHVADWGRWTIENGGDGASGRAADGRWPESAAAVRARKRDL